MSDVCICGHERNRLKDPEYAEAYRDEIEALRAERDDLLGILRAIVNEGRIPDEAEDLLADLEEEKA